MGSKAPAPPSEPVQPSYTQPNFSMPKMPQIDFGQAQRDLEAQRAEQERQQGINSMSELYDAKFAAANEATAQVNQQIADELSYAKLRGLDYTVPDKEAKLSRINKVFAALWSAEQENQLGQLVKQWGPGDYIWDSGIAREEGQATSIVSGGQSAGKKVPGPKTTARPEIDDEEKLGGTTTMLG